MNEKRKERLKDQITAKVQMKQRGKAVLEVR